MRVFFIKNKRFYLCFILISTTFFIWAQTKTQAISNFQQTKGFESASIGFCMMDNTGKVIYQINKSKSLTPASTLKLVTTASALEILGSSYTFKTELICDSENTNKLIVKGYGDPTLGSEYLGDDSQAFLEKWKTEIDKKGLSPNLLSEIEIDDSYFGYDGLSHKWIREDMGNYYASGSYGISIFDNSYKLFFNTNLGDSSPSPIILRTEPNLKNIRFTNNLQTNTTGKDNGYILGAPFSYDRLLVGDIPRGRSSFSIKGDIPDPGMFLGETFADYLNSHGFNIKDVKTLRSDVESKKITIGNLKSNSNVFYTHYSPPLRDIIRVINVRSNNHYSEHLIKAIGKYKDSTYLNNPLNNGIDAIKDLWTKRGINSESLFMYDGCGLAPSNAVSPEFMCTLLHYMQNKSKNKETFFASLPRAGKEGSVRSLLKGTRLEGKIYVKSGSIGNVQCFAGYYIEGNAKYSFSVMINNYTCTRREAVAAIEKLLLAICSNTK